MADERIDPGRARGFTLVELMIAVATMLVVTAMLTRSLVGVGRDQVLRQRVAQLQGDARQALGWMGSDLRQASLGAPTGTVWCDVGGNGDRRPSVQIFANLPGGGFLDVKPGTSAVLVIVGLNAPRAATVGPLSTTSGGIPVTQVAGFAAGQAVLVGEYGDASFGVIASVDAAARHLSLESLVNVLPGQQVKGLAAGAAVRAARARLYYVDTADELVRLTLKVPRAPSSLPEVSEREVLARGIENLQLDCLMDGGTGAFQGCPAPLGSTDPISVESQAAFGTFASGQGPRFGATAASLLRAVTVEASARSQGPVDPAQGDAKTPLAGVTLPVGGASDADAYVRRPYQMTAAVRNTSLGAY